jgi:SAM-dependent methyltransferase
MRGFGPGSYGPDSYGAAFADVYDDWYGDVSDVAATVAALRELAGAGPLLELGVGTGRLALPLAAAGVEVHGLDASEAMLARLRAKPGGDAVTLTLGDMATDLPAGPFTLVLCAYNTFFNLGSEEAQAVCFAGVAARLRPGGRFVLEAFVPEAFVPEDPRRSGSSVEVRDLALDRVVLSVARYDASTQDAHGQFVELTEAGGVRLRPWAIHWATPTQLDEMATAAGFALERRSAGWSGEPFTAASDEHVSIYRVPQESPPQA